MMIGTASTVRAATRRLVLSRLAFQQSNATPKSVATTAGTIRPVSSTTTTTTTIGVTSIPLCSSVSARTVDQVQPAFHRHEQRRWLAKDKRSGKNKKTKNKKGGGDGADDGAASAATSMSGGSGGGAANMEDLVFDDDDDDDNVDGTNEDEDDLPSLPDPSQIKTRMNKVVQRLEESFKSIQGSQPTPAMFESVPVSAYGDTVPLSTIAQVVIVSPTLAHLTPYDPSVAPDIRQAVQIALDMNPQLEDNNSLLTVKIPKVSMETRQQIVKQVAKQGETAKTHLRNVRRKAMDVVKKGKDGKLEGISKDDAFRVGKEIDATLDDVTKALNDAIKAKQDDIMNV